MLEKCKLVVHRKRVTLKYLIVMCRVSLERNTMSCFKSKGGIHHVVWLRWNTSITQIHGSGFFFFFFHLECLV